MHPSKSRLLTPKQVAAQILVRPGPAGGHFFNGLDSLAEAVLRIEPRVCRLRDRLDEVYVRRVRHCLGLVPRPLRVPDHDFEPMLI